MSIKYFAKLSNVLSNGEAYTRAIHAYYQYLGDMQKGEFLCVNNTKHQNIQIFDNSELMRLHWHSCHGIDQGEILLPFVMPALIKELEPALEHRAAVGTGTQGQVGPPGGHTGPGADAKLAGDAGTSNSKPKGTAGTGVESGKMSKKNHRGGNRSTTTGRGSKGTYTSHSAKKISSLRVKNVLNELQEKDKAIKAAKKEAKRLANALADLSNEVAGNTRPGTQPEGEARLGEGAGPSRVVETAQEVTESLTVATNPEEGKDTLDDMDVDIAKDLAAVNEDIAHDSVNTFRNKPLRREKQ